MWALSASIHSVQINISYVYNLWLEKGASFCRFSVLQVSNFGHTVVPVKVRLQDFFSEMEHAVLFLSSRC